MSDIPSPMPHPYAFASIVQETEFFHQPPTAGLFAAMATPRVNRNGGFQAVVFADLLRDTVLANGPSWWWHSVLTLNDYEFWIAQDVDINAPVNRLAGVMWSELQKLDDYTPNNRVFFGNVLMTKRGRQSMDIHLLPNIIGWAHSIGIEVLPVLGL